MPTTKARSPRPGAKTAAKTAAETRARREPESLANPAAPRAARKTAGEPRTLTLTVDATRSIAPHRIRGLVKAMGLAEGDRVRIEILGRDAGPRFDRAVAVARRAIEHFGGLLVVDEPGAAAGPDESE